MQKEIFDKLEAFTAKKNVGAYAYCLAMQDEKGDVTFHERMQQPCYGEMRIYNKGGWKPGDLHHPFPSGNPIGVSVNLTGFSSLKKNPSWSFVTGKDSLWWPLLEDRFVETEHGFVMTKTDFDSDYWFSFLLSLRMLPNNGERFQRFLKADVSPLTAWVAAMQTSGASNIQLSPSNTYSMAYPCSWKNLLNRTPLTFQGGTFFERKTLRDMPDNMASRIWSGNDTWKTLGQPGSVTLDHFLKETLPKLEQQK